MRASERVGRPRARRVRPPCKRIDHRRGRARLRLGVSVLGRVALAVTRARTRSCGLSVVLGRVQLGHVPREEVLVCKGALAVRPRADVVAAPEVRDVVVRRECLFLRARDQDQRRLGGTEGTK